MSFVFDVEKLQDSDSELIDYFTESDHAVRELKIRPTYITFHDLPQRNNYAKFTVNPDDGTVSSELRHLSFEENNENSNNEVWRNINTNEWIDEYDIIAILEQYVVLDGKNSKNASKNNVNKNNTNKNNTNKNNANKNNKKNNNTNKNKNKKSNKSRKNKASRK